MRAWLRGAVRPLIVCAVAGFLFFRADIYFGTGNGMLGLAVLGFLLAGSLAFDFIVTAQALVHPRRLDFAFVAGADYQGRRREALSRVHSSGLRLAVIPVGTAAWLCILTGHGPLFTLAAAGLMALESLALSAVFAAAIRFGAMPVSREKFPGGSTKTDLGLAGPSRVLRYTFALSGLLSSPASGSRRWVLRRTLLHILRRDPVFLGLYLVSMVFLGVAFHLNWSLILSGTYSLAGCMLTLTLVRLATWECDEYYGHCSYLMPGEGVKLRSDLQLYLALALLFAAYFAVLSVAHLGFRSALGSAGCWQVALTCMLFPFLIRMDAGTKGRSTDSFIVLNSCYLGISASLFLIPVRIAGLAIVLALMAAAAVRCLVPAGAGPSRLPH